jgi:CBS domain-containing membrane protein
MRIFRPILSGAVWNDRLLGGVGAAFGILLAGLIAACAGGSWPVPLLIAPIGASAVLVFAVPASPLAQPWPVIGGNMLSAVFALLIVATVAQPMLAAPLAVGGAIVLMSLCRCLHPPGGAVALSVVLLATSGHSAGWQFPLSPVAIDSAVLVVAGLLFHRVSGHSYPHRAATAPPSSAFETEDVDAALAAMHETFDIAREDLDALLAHAARHAAIRRGRSGRSSPRR